MVRAAIVGLGRWGQSLVRSVQDKSDVIRFVAGHTRTRAKAEAFCTARGIRLIDDYEALLRERDIDAVVLATPHSQHETQIKQAAAAGKHVFVEKPITLSHATALSAMRATEAAGVQLAVGYCRRFHPSFTEMRARLNDGRLGRLVGMVAQHTASANIFIPVDNWRVQSDEAPAGAMTAVGLHALDLMVEFGGRVKDVQCTTAATLPGPAADTTSVLLRFESGISGMIFCALATGTNFSFVAYGSNGLAEVVGASLDRLRLVPMSTQAPTGPITAPPDEIIDCSGFNMLDAELTEFARCIMEERRYPVPMQEVLHGMAVFDAAIESAATGKIVPVRD
jgi:predicted dehydrogenase